jgi:hypothetical protein
MKVIDVPVFNEDGSVRFTQVITAQEAQALLQFAINFLASTGMSVSMLVKKTAEANETEHVDITVQ